jgi:hypothetical protein
LKSREDIHVPGETGGPPVRNSINASENPETAIRIAINVSEVSAMVDATVPTAEPAHPMPALSWCGSRLVMPESGDVCSVV